MTLVDTSLSVIVPVYNEEQNVGDTLDRAVAHLQRSFEDWEIVVVESGSTDRSPDVIRDRCRQNPRISSIHQKRREGMGSALRAAYARCTKDWVAHMEADLPYEPKYLARASAHFDGSDFICGFRSGSEESEIMWSYSNSNYLESLVRGTFHYGYKILLNLLFGVYVNDINYSFKMIRREVVRTLDLRSTGWFIDTELVFELVRADARIKMMPIRYRRRERGRSKVTWLSPIPMMFDAFRYRFGRWRGAPRPASRPPAEPVRR